MFVVEAFYGGRDTEGMVYAMGKTVESAICNLISDTQPLSKMQLLELRDEKYLCVPSRELELVISRIW